MSGHEFQSHFEESGSVDMSDLSTSIDETTLAELRELASRYPQPRSALLPMLLDKATVRRSIEMTPRINVNTAPLDVL